MRTWRTRSIPAFDRSADYTRYSVQCMCTYTAMSHYCIYSTCTCTYMHMYIYMYVFRCFRLSDLEIGGVIGQGFYGAVTKVYTVIYLCINSFSCVYTMILYLIQVRHKYTGQEMVMKEMAKVTGETKISFLKEVSWKFRCRNWVGTHSSVLLNPSSSIHPPPSSSLPLSAPPSLHPSF